MYKKIRKAIGIKNTVVSGGGSLAAHLDDFFEILGLEVLNGWGLSEVRALLHTSRTIWRKPCSSSLKNCSHGRP